MKTVQISIFWQGMRQAIEEAARMVASVVNSQLYPTGFV